MPNVYPFPDTTDFSAALVQAQASGAKVIGLANSGLDTVNCVKQAREFGIGKGGQKVAGLIMYSTDVHAVGLETAQGLLMSETYYWDLNDRTRGFMERIKPKVSFWPNSIQAGTVFVGAALLQGDRCLGSGGGKSGRSGRGRTHESDADR